MNIKRATDHATKRGPASWFTGTVWIEEFSTNEGPCAVKSLRVSFEPGARTAWHSHAAGQTLHVLSGIGRIQKWGEPLVEIRPGDTIWIEAGEKHWHGASPARSMVHIAIQAEPGGKETTWYEQVTDSDYQG